MREGGKEENWEVIIENIDIYIKLKADIIKEVMNRTGNFYLEKCFSANNSEKLSAVFYTKVYFKLIRKIFFTDVSDNIH